MIHKNYNILWSREVLTLKEKNKNNKKSPKYQTEKKKKSISLVNTQK